MHNLTKGKIGELFAEAEFLKHGFDVFTTSADVFGIDMIVSIQDNFYKVQVKTATNKYNRFHLPHSPPKSDLLFLANSKSGEYWIVPTKTLYNHIKVRGLVKDSQIVSIPEKIKKDYCEFGYFSKYKMKRQFHAGIVGKMGEKIGISYLLLKEYECFPSEVDTRGIDGIICKDGKYYELQIKYASSSYQYRNVLKTKDDNNTFFLFIRGDKYEFFLIPAKVVRTKSHKSGSITLNQEMRDEYKI
jgi:hypothetical protein